MTEHNYRVFANPHHIARLVPALRQAAALLGTDLPIYISYDSTSFVLLRTDIVIVDLMLAYITIEDNISYEYV